jgi:branched-subunit amino acid ABC-type transport system permease component
LGALYFALIAPRLSNPEASAAFALPAIFIGAVVLSFLIYRFVLKLIMKKVDIEKHFDPIFGGRKPPRNS